MLRRKDEVVEGMVARGHRVVGSTQLPGEPVDPALGPRLRAAEHHVLGEVGETRLAGGLVERSRPVHEQRRHDG